MATLFVLLLISLFVVGNTQVVSRVVVAAAGVAFTGFLLWLSRRSYYAAAYSLTGFYILFAAGSVASWGIGNTFGILLLSLTIILASTLLSSRHALYAAALSAVIMIGVQLDVEAGWIHLQPIGSAVPSIGDAVGYSVVFAMLAIISWLFGGRMETSLLDTEKAERALEREKQLLEVRLHKYGLRLQKAQMDEMRQLYQFAEIGQLSTALLHDLANHLTVLNIEIDGIRGKQHTEALSRSRAIVTQLDTMLDEVRDRLAGHKADKRYNLIAVISDAIERCTHNYPQSDVEVDWTPPADITMFELVGDPLKCSQVITILLRNAFDAYAKEPAASGRPPRMRIAVGVKKVGKHIRVSVTDWGVGIPADMRSKIFRPAYTTKTKQKGSGMGLGLYLASQMVITEFSGTLKLSDATDRTEFIVTLPITDDH
ncbi:MAG TPA: HAMP domain-containing sensor histidine kinase [Candidatus Saccharimonadales bacterium]|nr:HAMP domain-containing sensor histidine kinase [Candidatus Saccharimonadales bacterium]